MDNEKKNFSEQNTNGDVTELDSAPITAEDLIRRLKSNIRQNPNLQGADLFEDAVEETAETKEEEPVIPEEPEVEVQPQEDEPSRIFKFRKKNKKKARSDDDVDLNDVVTESAEPVLEPSFEDSGINPMKELADLLAGKAEEAEETEETVVSEEIVAEEVIDKEAEEAESIFEQIKVEVEYSEPAAEEAEVEESVVEQTSEETRPVSKEYVLNVENAAEKTNVFEPNIIKNALEADEKNDLFGENEKPIEAEQLSFGMAEDELQKSIQEAEAFIYDREHIDSPEDVINAEQIITDGLIGDGTAAEEFDQTDLWIASAFGDEDEIKEMYGEDAAQEIQTEIDIEVSEYLKKEEKEAVETAKIEEEYTSREQNKTFFANYRKEHKISLIKLAICFVLMLVALVYDNLSSWGGTLPGALNPANYAVVHILVSLQLLVLAGALAWKQLYFGARALIVWKPIPESMSAVVVAMSVIYHIVHCFISEIDPNVSLYVFPVILCIFFTLLGDFLDLKREILSFNIVASKRQKYIINHVEKEKATLENDAFSDYLSNDEEPSMFKIVKTGFVENFRSRMNSYSKNNSIINILIPVVVALGIVFFIISTVIFDAKTAFSAAYLAFILAAPFSLLLSFSYPFYSASKKAFEDDSAIIGSVSLEEYSHANTLSFEDRDVFPSYGVKVKSIKVYGDSRIDKILYNAAAVFKKVGGPLADVFDMATHELDGSDNVEIIDIAKDGIESIVDGQHIYVGRASYLRTNNFVPMYEPDDDAIEDSGDACIMYMVCNDEVAAKMYVQYIIDPDFEYTLRQLYKAGICIGIKTFDPNIDDRLLGSKIRITKYPVRILRGRNLDDMSVPEESSDSGLVSRNSPKSLLQAFALCNKVLNTAKAGIMVKMLSIVFSVLLMAFLLVFASQTTIPSLYVALYQLFWMIPVYLISKTI
ncbi:MAG: hypothetical protein IKL40_02155 [Clostridia bacterium]|nr:hypothetical protein [Clostridia bacterium]